MGSYLCVDSEMGKDPQLTGKHMGLSEQKDLPVPKLSTWIAKLLIMDSYLCIYFKKGKDPLPTDKTMGESGQKNPPANPLAHFIRVLRMLTLIDQIKIQWRSP